ncbi:DUF2461 domain-containing protein [Silvibacterium dinghuense]|uniref:DUF2461 domain-containing protein n=1 Tax=Silvibacterium dinghuense TaxID=1560006 RepID=A0A4Q1SK25_9BACT|nr:DUF2461 domain-containing protein [Silvibacterium dinghuense]RXS97807.1 DUF2461 domain-containing protein [Silvibacterium dinghuense]GGH02095.1 TIGR02453 family protein [Silvibacterium dinghuense]
MQAKAAKKAVAKKKTSTAKSHPTAVPYFREAGLKFLRDLKRNNRREWFEARREVYEQELKQPMLALIERLTAGMMDYAPGHIRPAHKSLFRIYRDTRFSADKTPYKTHIAAWWTHAGLEKTSGSGYYLQIAPEGVLIAAGVYMPPKEQLFAIRTHLLAHHERFRALVEDKKLRRVMNLHEPMALTRPPKGFPAEHPALEWVRWRQWGVLAELPAATALRPDLSITIEKYFRLSTPLVGFLNEPLLAAAQPKRKPLFGLS